MSSSSEKLNSSEEVVKALNEFRKDYDLKFQEFTAIASELITRTGAESFESTAKLLRDLHAVSTKRDDEQDKRIDSLEKRVWFIENKNIPPVWMYKNAWKLIGIGSMISLFFELFWHDIKTFLNK